MARRIAKVTRATAVKINTNNRWLGLDEGTAFTTYLFRFFSFLFNDEVAIVTSDFPVIRQKARD